MLHSTALAGHISRRGSQLKVLRSAEVASSRLMQYVDYQLAGAV